MDMWSYMKKTFRQCYLQCLLTALTFGLIGPVTLYISNQSEFAFHLSDILPLMILATVAGFAVLTGICILMKNKVVRGVVSAVILGIGVAFYIQANFMSGGYGQLNGQDIDWSSMVGKGILNTLVWLACIIIPVVVVLRKKRNRFGFQKVAAGLALAIQILGLVLVLVSSGGLDTTVDDDFTVYTSDAFTLSEEKNVVVFLLDNFSSVLFEEIITEDTSYSAKFDGFTYFPDTVGVGCNTKGSLPFILTGLWNENSYKYKDYLNKGFDNNNLYEKLDDLEYDSRLFVDKKYLGNTAVQYFENMSGGKTKVAAGKIAPLMYKFTAFTYMPHFLKPAFWFYSGEFSGASQSVANQLNLSNDPEFYKSLVKHGVTVNKDYEGAYRFYYLSGAHSPFNMNENAEAVDSGSVTMKQRAKGALKIVADYLQKLRELDLYDNTMVVVMADHGNWEEDVVFNPMFFVKPFDSDVKGLQTSNAPITYEDLMPTLIEAVTGKDAGTTVFEVEENAQRERRFLFYNWDGVWEADFLPDLHEYVVNGNIRDITSRAPTGRVYTSTGLVTNTVAYKLGQSVSYKASASGEQTYVYYGMQYAEEGHTWTKGNYTNWFFPLESYEGGDLRFSMELIAAKNGSQRVFLTVNDQFVEEVTVTSGGQLNFTIPANLIIDKNLSIRLDYPDAASSESDERVLALAIRSVVLDYAQ